MGAPNRLLALQSGPESGDPEWDHPDYAAILSERGAPQEGPGRAPTPEERAGGNPLLRRWYQGGEDMHARAERGLTTADVVRAIGLATMAVRGGYVNGARPGGMPAPMSVPMPRASDRQPLFYDGEVPQTLIAPLGAYANKAPQPYDGPRTERESVGGHLEQLPEEMRGHGPHHEGGQQFYEPLPGIRVENPLAMSPKRLFSAMTNWTPGGYTGAAEIPAIMSSATRLLQTPRRGFGLGTSKVEPLGRGAAEPLRFGDAGQPDAEPPHITAGREVAKLVPHYTPGQRESENVEIGAPMRPWDEFMTNLGPLLHGGYKMDKRDEERLNVVNYPSEVRRILEALRNREGMSYPPAPELLPGPR